jgi:hypothetical protein
MDARYQGSRGHLSKEAHSYQGAVRRAGRETGYSVLSGSTGGVALVDELQELHRIVVGNRHTHAVAQVAMTDSGWMVGVQVLVARYSLVVVRISSRPFPLPFEQLLARMPLTAED